MRYLMTSLGLSKRSRPVRRDIVVTYCARSSPGRAATKGDSHRLAEALAGKEVIPLAT